MNILVVDTKLMMYKQHHGRKPTLGMMDEIARLGLKHLPYIHKVVFVKDLGQSKRAKIFPGYKEKRAETKKKMSATESGRLSKFLDTYNKSDSFLSDFGSVIAINGIEADDLGSMIAERLSGAHNIYLLSGDEDWSRFLVNPNTYQLHPQRERLITLETAEEEFGVHPQYKLIIDSFTGVDKESVDGIIKLGKVRAVKFFAEAGHNVEIFSGMLDVFVEIKQYGMSLPAWATTSLEVYERNSKIFEAHTYESLTLAEQAIFQKGWSTKPSRNSDTITKKALLELGLPFVPSHNVQSFFNLTI